MHSTIQCYINVQFKNSKAFGPFKRLLEQVVNPVFVRQHSKNAPHASVVANEGQWKWTLPEGFDTGIKVKNSYYLERSASHAGIVPFIVKDPKYVTWYACGPTVYDSSHIGHASTFIQFDLIRRILTRFFNMKISMVMGLTNMDNKIINRAMLYDRDVMEVADKYEMEFKEDMKNLNVLPPTTYIRVTDIIPQIIDFIRKIIDQKQAYVTEKGNVYFSYNDASQLVPKLWKEFYEPDVAMGEKKFAKDVLLWKAAKPGEPYWDSPWCKGRPGWHIECSVMASMCFGDAVDIHSGAIDLRFPHHEYEIAQCDAYHGCKQWVNYFMHTGHMKLKDGEKMSKSLGNMVTIRECLEEQKEADYLRMLCCANQWNTNFIYKPNPGEATHTNFDKFRAFFNHCEEIMSGRTRVTIDNEEIIKAVADCDSLIMNRFRNNFAVKKAMGDVFKLMKKVTEKTTAVEQSETNFSDISGVVRAVNFVDEFLCNLGFRFHCRNTKIGES